MPKNAKIRLIFRILLVALSLALLTLCVTSCATQREVRTVTVHHTDTVYKYNLEKDSVYVFRDRYVSGDTVYLTSEKSVYRVKIDTVYQRMENDSVRVQYIEKTRTETRNSGFCVTCTILFWVLIGAGVCLICYKIYRNVK